jgi:Rod binding domain-containing protein
MSTSVPGIFTQSVFSGVAKRATTQKAAAAGFAQIFTTMLAHQMHQSMVGDDVGPMGIGGGASGDIYGSLLDQAMGTTLAKSKSMAGLTRMISRGLGRQSHPVALALKNSLLKVANSSTVGGLQIGRRENATENAAMMQRSSQFGSGTLSGRDARGPILLPPRSESVAPLLLPPSPLEG